MYHLPNEQKTYRCIYGKTKNGQSTCLTHYLNLYFPFLLSFLVRNSFRSHDRGKVEAGGQHTVKETEDRASLHSSVPNALVAVAPTPCHLVLDSRPGQAVLTYLRSHPTSTTVSTGSGAPLFFFEAILISVLEHGTA